MPLVKCPAPDCAYVTPNADTYVVAVLLQIHGSILHILLPHHHQIQQVQNSPALTLMLGWNRNHGTHRQTLGDFSYWVSDQ